MHVKLPVWCQAHQCLAVSSCCHCHLSGQCCRRHVVQSLLTLLTAACRSTHSLAGLGMLGGPASRRHHLTPSLSDSLSPSIHSVSLLLSGHTAARVGPTLRRAWPPCPQPSLLCRELASGPQLSLNGQCLHGLSPHRRADLLLTL